MKSFPEYEKHFSSETLINRLFENKRFHFAYFSYLSWNMRSDKLVQFVYFETKLDSKQFIEKWKEFSRSDNSELDVTLQKYERNGAFRYVAQHRYTAGEFQFLFTKAVRSGRLPEIEIKATQAGGYSILEASRLDDTHSGESKVFAFLIDPLSDLDDFRQLSAISKLNIYEAYYENCRYPYILEFFVKNKYAPELMEQLKQMNVTETGIYKECAIPKMA